MSAPKVNALNIESQRGGNYRTGFIGILEVSHLVVHSLVEAGDTKGGKSPLQVLSGGGIEVKLRD